MQQPCKKCGYVSPEADKFCRSCGEQLSTESEFSAAVTLNHSKVDPNPPVAVAGTGRFPPNIGDTIAGPTERFYLPPQYAPMPVQMAQPPYFSPPKSESFPRLRLFGGFMKGLFFFLLFAGLVGATAGAVFFSQEARRERQRSDDLERRAEARASANGRAKDAWEQMEEALKLIQEAREKAAGAGATLSTSDERPIDLGRYAYPGAWVEATVGSSGNQTLSLFTHDNFDTVRAFYERQFGKPVIQAEVNDYRFSRNYYRSNGKKLLFQSSASPPLLITVEEYDGRVKITIMHSLLRFPKDR